MEIVKRKIDELLPAPYNPRKDLQPADKEYQQLKKSIQEYGYVEPIIYNKQTGMVVGGHQRLKVLKDLGFADIECVEVDLDETQEKALNIALNKISGSWDTEKLKDLLLDLQSLDYDLDLTGFSIDELNDLDIVGIEPEKEVEEDDFDESTVPDEPIAKYGEIYKLGNHRLMCGDSTSITDVEKLLGGMRANIVFTDPPYGYNYQSNRRKKTDKFDVIKNDDKILDFFPNINIVCDGFVFICTTWKVLDKWLPLFKQYHELTNMIIWDKGGGGIGDLKHTFLTDYEIILCSNNGKELKGKRIGSVWDVAKDNANKYIHPTQKPVELSALAIKETTDIGDAVLDLFGGSGSTLIACEQLKRNCFMMELDPHYVDVIIARWEQYTGKKAERIETN